MRILWLFAILGWSVAGCVPVAPADRGSVPPNPVSVATPIDPFARARRLQPGINLGNALEAPAEGEWGLVIREEWFALMAEAGFRSVRLPVRWSAHALETAPYTIDERFFVRVEQVVEQATRRGLAVVLNMHHYEEMAGDPLAHQERFVAMWAQIAERFAAAPETLYFELLNEPNLALTAPLWNEMLATVIPVVRASNPARTLIAGPVDWNNFRRLPDLALPADETNVIVTIHYYDPFPFTHQGAEWVPGADAWLGTAWGSAGEQAAVAADLDQAAAWATAAGRPLYLGEFSAYSKAEEASRLLWTDFVARQAELREISWAYWEFGAGFGIYQPGRRQWNEPLRDALLGQ